MSCLQRQRPESWLDDVRSFREHCLQVEPSASETSQSSETGAVTSLAGHIARSENRSNMNAICNNFETAAFYVAIHLTGKMKDADTETIINSIIDKE